VLLAGSRQGSPAFLISWQGNDLRLTSVIGRLSHLVAILRHFWPTLAAQLLTQMLVGYLPFMGSDTSMTPTPTRVVCPAGGDQGVVDGLGKA
jgi:hypothetical protein